MFKSYISFTVSLIYLMLYEWYFISSYSEEQPFPWSSFLGFLPAFFAIYASIELFKKEIKDSKKSEKDAELFMQLMELMPPEKTISFFRKTDFNGRVPRGELEGLRQFRTYWDSVDKEFFDSTIEADRKKIYSAIDRFMEKYSMYTVPVGDGNYASVYPDETRNEVIPQERLNNLKEQADELNSLADSLATQYEIFVRKVKSKFII